MAGKEVTLLARFSIYIDLIKGVKQFAIPDYGIKQKEGIPFVISALLIDYLKSAFDWIKRNYRVINAVCGWLLVLMGLLMATGLMGRFLALLS